jgi:hypothetical protein
MKNWGRGKRRKKGEKQRKRNEEEEQVKENLRKKEGREKRGEAFHFYNYFCRFFSFFIRKSFV